MLCAVPISGTLVTKDMRDYLCDVDPVCIQLLSSYFNWLQRQVELVDNSSMRTMLNQHHSGLKAAIASMGTHIGLTPHWIEA